MDISLPASLRKSLFSLTKAQTLSAQTQLRLATGRKVNSATDDTNAFFAAQGLSNAALQLNLLLDSAGQSIQTVKAAQQGLDTMEQLLQQAKATASDIFTTKSFTGSTINDLITAQNPVAYWRLNEPGGATAVNLGTGGAALNGTYQGSPTLGGTAIYTNGGEPTAVFDGSNDRIAIPDNNLINTSVHDERTIELVFNANTTAGRQVLYEEGATVNALSIYIDNGLLYVNGTDSGDWGPFNISQPIAAGETYHVALVLDEPNGELRGYLNGQLMGSGAVTTPLASHSGDIGIGRMNDGSYFHDGSQTGDTFAFNGQIAEVALYNSVLSQAELELHYTSLEETPEGEAIQDLLQAVSDVPFDASYRGVRLLMEDRLTTIFNETASSVVETQGRDFSLEGLGIDQLSFANEADTLASIEAIESAIENIRSFSTYLTSNTGSITRREEYLARMVNTLQAGSDSLTIADLNEESANMLALETARSLSLEAIQITSSADQAVLQLF